MKTIIAFLMLVSPAFAEEWTAPDTNYFMQGPATSLSFTMGGEVLVSIHADGTIEYGKNYTPDAAAKQFWDAMGVERKARNCQ